MTGFGRAELTRGGMHVVVELRALNQRFFELKPNLPRGWGSQEAEFRKLVQETIERGRVELFVRTTALNPPTVTIKVNEALARDYVRELRQLGKTLGLNGKLELEAVLQRPEIFRVEEAEADPTAGVELALTALRRALKALAAERAREGLGLKRDFEQRHLTLVEALPRIDQLSAAIRESIRENFLGRLRDLLAEAPINEKRLYDDALVAASHGDITEEMTRLRVHLKALRTMIAKPGAVGKAIEFLLQEINREINTIGAKSQDAQLSQITIAMKGEVEKMREQVQNVE
jgi:uncharacterized protein (TIGR00255 family)